MAWYRFSGFHRNLRTSPVGGAVSPLTRQHGFPRRLGVEAIPPGVCLPPKTSTREQSKISFNTPHTHPPLSSLTGHPGPYLWPGCSLPPPAPFPPPLLILSSILYPSLLIPGNPVHPIRPFRTKLEQCRGILELVDDPSSAPLPPPSLFLSSIFSPPLPLPSKHVRTNLPVHATLDA